MPFALLVLAGAGEAANAPVWLGRAAAALAFLLVGAGLHTTQTVGLALATDLAPAEDRPKVVGLMYVMLLVGMIVSALVFGALLVNFTAGRLVQVIQGCALATLILNVTALWKQEARRPRRGAPLPAAEPSFQQAWARFSTNAQARRRLVALGVGTMAFGMADILLEPYGGQVLGLTVGSTTKLTAALAGGTLAGFAWASRILSRGFDPLRMAGLGAIAGVPGFLVVIGAAPLDSPPLFVTGTMLIGFGAGLFGHGTLTATMQLAPRDQVGLAATQVDVHRRVVVMDLSGDASAPQVFVNPQVLSQDTVGMVEESCLSVPGVVDSVRRATRLQVRALDRKGAAFERRLEGVTAVCLLHEIDHLDGRLFVDHLSYLRRLRLSWKLGRERKPVAA